MKIESRTLERAPVRQTTLQPGQESAAPASPDPVATIIAGHEGADSNHQQDSEVEIAQRGEGTSRKQDERVRQGNAQGANKDAEPENRITIFLQKGEQIGQKAIGNAIHAGSPFHRARGGFCMMSSAGEGRGVGMPQMLWSLRYLRITCRTSWMTFSTGSA